MLGLSALAAFGAVEIAVVYGVVGAIMELTLEQIPLNPIYIRRERRSSRIGQV